MNPSRLLRTRPPWRLQSVVALWFLTIPLAEAQPGVYATLTSDYVYRGQLMTDDNPALQLGLDYWHESGWFVGAWASTIDLRTAAGKRELEFDYYLGFSFQPASTWSVAFTLLSYTYPGASGDHAYDYTEGLAAVTWDDRWTLEMAYTDDLYGLRAVGRHWTIRGEQPVGDAWLVGGGLGGNDFSDLGTSHFLHWDLGASYRVARFSFDFRYYGSERPGAGLARRLAVDSQIVVSITATF